MLRFSRWKLFSTIAVILVGLALAFPSSMNESERKAFMDSLPSWVPHWLVPQRAIVLGLDLQGGSQILLEADANDLIRGRSGMIAGLRDEVRTIIRQEKIIVEGGIQVLPKGVQIRVPQAADQAKILPKLRALSQPVGGGVIEGGPPSILVTTTPDGAIQINFTDEGISERIRRTIGRAIEVVRRRIDSMGTREPTIQRQGADRILVQVPGLQDPRQLIETLGKTAKLEFRFLARPGDTDVDMLPLRDNGGQPAAVERRVIVGGEDLTDSQPSFHQTTNQPIVTFNFNARGAQRFGQATSEGVGRNLAIVLDNEIISAPRVDNAITQGAGIITGEFTTEQTTNLSLLLRSGALPAKLTVVEERTVGPGLGKDSIEAGKKATLVAAIFVIIFMFATYGVFGFFANIALLVHVGLILGLMSALGATMTLPGIAGIVLTIGTAVDSNVLIYERIREEFKEGRSVIASIEAGFHRAFATIIDANSTMAIAALILFFLGSGPVKGFAVVFLLGILTTVITAVTLTRMMIAAWYFWRRPKSIPF